MPRSVIPLYPSSNIGFTHLVYEPAIEGSRKQVLTLYLPDTSENRDYYNQDATVLELRDILVFAEKKFEEYDQESLQKLGFTNVKKSPPYVTFKISATRKIYQILQWFQSESQYSWTKASRDLINTLVEDLRKCVQSKPLPPLTFWPTKFEPVKGLFDLDSHKSRITVKRSDKGETVYSRKVEADSKFYEIVQINSIYHSALLGDRASLDVLVFDENHARKELNSIEIKNFKSMDKLRKSNQLPSMIDFVKKGAASLDVDGLVWGEADRNGFNYGLNSRGNFVKIDHDLSAWDFICKYHNQAADEAYEFYVDERPGVKYVAKSPAEAVKYSVEDIDNLPFVRHVELINGPVNSFLGRRLGGDLGYHLRGIQKNPDYICEKHRYFLKAVLFPDSFHQRVNRDLMSPSSHVQQNINYRRSRVDYAREITFSCDNFWLYVYSHPRWQDQIVEEFSFFNRRMKQYFNADNLMNIEDVVSLYDEIFKESKEKIRVIVPELLKEVTFLINVYQNQPKKEYIKIVSDLKLVEKDLQDFVAGKNDTIPIYFLDQVKYQISQIEFKKNGDFLNDYCLLDQAIAFIRLEKLPSDGFDLLGCVFLNNLQKINNAIVMNYLNESKLNEVTPLGFTAVEIALAYGHQQIAKLLFQCEDDIQDFSPFLYHSDKTLYQAAWRIREAAKDYFLEMCESANKNHNGLFRLGHDLGHRMNDVFQLLQVIKRPYEEVNDMKFFVNNWVEELDKGLFRRSQLGNKVREAMAEIPEKNNHMEHA